MADPTCARTGCDRPLRHDQAVMCSPCASRLRAILRDTASLAGQVARTIAKLDVMPAGGPGAPDDLGWWKTGNALEAIELPYRPRAKERYEHAWGELATWARHCCEERGIDYAETGLDGLCGFLSGQLEWLRHREEVTEAYPVIEDACRQIEHIVDRRAEGEFIGMCPCGTALYHHGGTTTKCSRCGTAYDPASSRADYNAAMEAARVLPSEAADRVAIMGLVTDTAKLRKLIWAWGDRGHLVQACEHDSCMAVRRREVDGPACQPAEVRYRFGDVLARVMASPALRVA